MRQMAANGNHLACLSGRPLEYFIMCPVWEMVEPFLVWHQDVVHGQRPFLCARRGKARQVTPYLVAAAHVKAVAQQEPPTTKRPGRIMQGFRFRRGGDAELHDPWIVDVLPEMGGYDPHLMAFLAQAVHQVLARVLRAPGPVRGVAAAKHPDFHPSTSSYTSTTCLANLSQV